MSLRSVVSRVLVSYARPQAYVEKTSAILSRLGYRIVDVDAWATEQTAAGIDVASAAAHADLLVVDESRFCEVRAARPGTPAAELPIVLLTGRKGIREEDPRIVGAIKRPAGLHDLYRLLQQLFEETPRATPRIATDLAAFCMRGDAHWKGQILSLAENGCLLRGGEGLPLGSLFQLAFELPGSSPIEVRAEAAYQLVPELGVVFSGLEPGTRARLTDYVNEAILAA